MTGQDVIELRRQIDALRRQIDGIEASLDMLLPVPIGLVATVLRETALIFDVTVEELLADRRAMRIVLPRQAAYWVAEKVSKQSLAAIGQHIGGRDHSTIVSGLAKAKTRRAADAAYRRTTNALLARVRKVDAHA